jgi:predicted Zn-dependent protease
LAYCGEARAKLLSDELIRSYPEDTLINSIWLPAIRGAIELRRDNAAQALVELQASSRCEGAAEFLPQYLRGQAYLRLKRSGEAAAEFQRIIDHRGQAPLSPLYPLAHRGLANAAHLAGDEVKSSKALAEFKAFWKDADPGIAQQ